MNNVFQTGDAFRIINTGENYICEYAVDISGRYFRCV